MTKPGRSTFTHAHFAQLTTNKGPSRGPSPRLASPAVRSPSPRAWRGVVWRGAGAGRYGASRPASVTEAACHHTLTRQPDDDLPEPPLPPTPPPTPPPPRGLRSALEPSTASLSSAFSRVVAPSTGAGPLECPSPFALRDESNGSVANMLQKS